MKTLIATTVALAALVILPGAAMAQESVEVGGDAPKICTLPNDWHVTTTAGGANAGQFGGSTWTIPTTQFSTATGQPYVSGEIAMRIRGSAFCNTSHTIQVSSLHGGLTQGDGTTAAPAGFANRRAVTYQALWVASGTGNSTVVLGNSASLTATTPGATTTRPYVVSASLPPPGAREFDLRIGVARTSTTPLVAGAYSDVVTIRLTPAA